MDIERENIVMNIDADENCENEEDAKDLKLSNIPNESGPVKLYSPRPGQMDALRMGPVRPIPLMAEVVAKIHSGEMLGKFGRTMKLICRQYGCDEYVNNVTGCLRLYYQHYRGHSISTIAKVDQMERTLNASDLQSKLHLLQFLLSFKATLLQASGEIDEAESLLVGMVQGSRLEQPTPLMYRTLATLLVHRPLKRGFPPTKNDFNNADNLYLSSQQCPEVFQVELLVKYRMEFGFMLLRCCPSGRHLLVGFQQNFVGYVEKWEAVRNILHWAQHTTQTECQDVHDAVFYYYLLSCDYNIRKAQIEVVESNWKQWKREAYNYANKAKDQAVTYLKNWRSFPLYADRRLAFLQTVSFATDDDQIYSYPKEELQHEILEEERPVVADVDVTSVKQRNSCDNAQISRNIVSYESDTKIKRLQETITTFITLDVGVIPDEEETKSNTAATESVHETKVYRLSESKCFTGRTHIDVSIDNLPQVQTNGSPIQSTSAINYERIRNESSNKAYRNNVDGISETDDMLSQPHISFPSSNCGSCNDDPIVVGGYANQPACADAKAVDDPNTKRKRLWIMHDDDNDDDDDDDVDDNTDNIPCRPPRRDDEEKVVQPLYAFGDFPGAFAGPMPLTPNVSYSQGTNICVQLPTGEHQLNSTMGSLPETKEDEHVASSEYQNTPNINGNYLSGSEMISCSSEGTSTFHTFDDIPLNCEENDSIPRTNYHLLSKNDSHVSQSDKWT